MKKTTNTDADTGSSSKADKTMKEGGSNTIRKSRRRLIQVMVAGGVVATAKTVPNSWSRPVVNSVVLPAHAETSGGLINLGNNGNFFVMNTQDLERTESLLASGIGQGWDAIYKALVEEAAAGSDGIVGCGLAGCSHIEYLSGSNSGKLFVFVGDLEGDSPAPEEISFDFTDGQTGSLNSPCLNPAIDFRVDLVSDELAKLTLWIDGPVMIDLVKNYECTPEFPGPGEDGFN